MSNAFILSGRFLLGLYFLVPGLLKFAAPDMHLALMEAHSVPMAEPLMWVAAVANVAGGTAADFRPACLPDGAWPRGLRLAGQCPSA